MGWNGQKPAGSAGWSEDQWMDWLAKSCRLLPVAGWPGHRCAGCWIPSKLAPDGTPFLQCYKCFGETRLARNTRSVTPIAYGTFDGLTGLIRKYKDGDAWLAAPLRALLQTFVDRHWNHLVQACGAPTHMTWVPSHESRPGGDHLERVVGGLRVPHSVRLTPDILCKMTADSAARSLHASAFEARGVQGANVLLIDDVLTTGGTLSSAAAALREAGAKDVSAIVLTRHLNPEYYRPHADMINHQQTIAFDRNTCAYDASAI